MKNWVKDIREAQHSQNLKHECNVEVNKQLYDHSMNNYLYHANTDADVINDPSYIKTYEYWNE